MTGTLAIQMADSTTRHAEHACDAPAFTVAMLLSCDSFESFFGGVLGLDQDRYLSSYRNDWAWYYAAGLQKNGVVPVLYLPSLRHAGLYPTEEGILVRFLPLASWFRLLSPFRRAVRITRWTLYLYERLNAAAFSKPLKDALVTDGSALLYVQEYWSGRYDHVANRTSVPVVAADHGAVAMMAAKFAKRKTLKRAVLLYCQTRKEQALVESYGGHAVVQPNGVDTSYFAPRSKAVQRRKNIATVARLNDKHKRTSDLIRALQYLPQEWTLDIVGTGPDQTMLKELAGQLGVASRVTFYGFQGKEEVRSMLQCCGVYAMPSGHEAICLAVLEAMACGAAVVASRINAFESMITDGKNGLLYPVGDVTALARAIQKAWKAREALGTAAAQTASAEFDASSLYRRLAQSMRASVGLTCTSAL